MDNLEFIFHTFDREDFTYRLERPGVQEVREQYRTSWNRWKTLVSNSLEKSNTAELSIEGTESWQNSGSLSKRFWTRIKVPNRTESSSCIAVMINKENLRVYLEWHNYRTNESSNTIKDHNNWLSYIEEWTKAKNINPKDYRVWTSEDGDYENYFTLEQYITNNEIRSNMNSRVENNSTEWIRVGKVFSKEEISDENAEEIIAKGINELNYIYKKTDNMESEQPEPDERKYWLFNTYYARNETVWELSKLNGYVVMQYEEGKQDKAAVTRNVRIAEQVQMNDIIIAYSGAKGFLGYGKVQGSYYEETDATKFLNVNGDPWRQRIDVDWEQALEKPVKYHGTDFAAKLGLQASTNFGSFTITEISQLGFNFVKELLTSKDIIKEPEKRYDQISSEDMVNHIYRYILSKGFYFTIDEIKNVYLALKTKPFVILSGISGTGKTKIVQLIAESIGATEKNDRFTLIPVKPDWSDGSDLLGYRDIKGDFQWGALTTVIDSASKNLDEPYFVVLDEMNLARVEYYFSDFLSIIESRRWEEGKITSSILLSKEQVGEALFIPPNLYIIGTVNMDETTHPFSKKVLDRANTIEFNEVKLDFYSFDEELTETSPFLLHNDQLQSKYLFLKDAYTKQNEEAIKDVTARLMEINEILQPIQAQVGYRVRDEICFYVLYSKFLMKRDKAFDFQLYQKILPRITASESQAFDVLKSLYKYCTNHEFDENATTIPKDVIENAKYSKSAKKVYDMLRRGQLDGFTSFWNG